MRFILQYIEGNMEKNKTIWIWNHYATDTYFDRGGRHYWFAKYLIRNGYDVKIFCASTVHNTSENIDTSNGLYVEKKMDGISYVFIKTPDYMGNGKSRVKNMYSFYKKLYKVYKKFTFPDYIIASSVHPLTLVAGIKIGKKMNVPCICEIRDLWPESLIEYGIINKNGVVSKFLQLGEKWIYNKADALIFTMEGGKDYIREKGWDSTLFKRVDLKKVFYINNGIDMEILNENKRDCQINDEDLEIKDTIKIVYTGSIRLSNHVEHIVEAAEMLKSDNRFMFLIYGDGDKRQELELEISKKNLRNIKVKGRVEKNNIPYILSKADYCITDICSADLFKYGISPNKMFDYLGAQKPIISGMKCNYDIIDSKGLGITIKSENGEGIVEALFSLVLMSEADKKQMQERISKAVVEFDFENLTKNLMEVIDYV